MEYKENVIEWVNGDEKAALTLNREKHKTRIKKLKAQYPDEVDFIINRDGSMFAHIPVSWVRISPPRKVDLTDEQKQILADRMRLLRSTD